MLIPLCQSGYQTGMKQAKLLLMKMEQFRSYNDGQGPLTRIPNESATALSVINSSGQKPGRAIALPPESSAALALAAVSTPPLTNY